jgi:hypothetical protein
MTAVRRGDRILGAPPLLSRVGSKIGPATQNVTFCDCDYLDVNGGPD